MDSVTTPSPFAFVDGRDRCLTLSAPTGDVEYLLQLHFALGPAVFKQPNLSKAQLLLASKLEHEIDHLHRFLGTSLGLVLYRIFSEQVRLAILELRDSSGDLQLPFSEDTPFMKQFERLRLLELILMCPSTRIPVHTTIDVREALTRLAVKQEICFTDQHGAYLPAPLAESRVGRHVRMAPFGGYGLWEYLGLSRELSLRKHYDIDYGATDSMIRVHAYQQVGQLWKAAVRRTDESDRTPFSSELYLACDLASWIPIGPFGIVENPKGASYSWQDIQPGHRFQKILHRLDLSKEVSSLTKLDSAYEDWFLGETTRICDELGWATPDAIAKEWRISLNEPCTDGQSSLGFICDDQDRIDGSLTMLQVRKKFPGKGAHGYWCANNKRSLWFPSIVLLDGRKQTLVGPDEARQEVSKLGYRYPVATSLNSALDLLVRKRDESLMGPDLIAKYRSQTKHVVKDLSNYTDRHFGFILKAGRSDPSR